MKKIFRVFSLLFILVFVNQACTVGNSIQIKNLKDEMTIVKARLDSLEMKMKRVDRVIVDSLKIKNK